jgi:hypothetical protein
MSTALELVVHKGGCHCGQVAFEVQAPADLFVYNCNCSVCTKKQNRHFIVPKSRFKLIKGEDYLTTYTFNTHRAKHMFCRVCGVQSFYQPRSNPDGYGVMPHCIDPSTIRSINVENFDGVHWQEAMDKESTREVPIHTWSQSTTDDQQN